VQSQENDMTELVMKTEAEVEDFTDELSDEALDRAEGASLLLRRFFTLVTLDFQLSGS
jgi:hypothetical protein